MIPANSSKKTDHTTIVSEDVEERGPLADRLLFWLLKHPYQRVSDMAFVFQKHPATVSRQINELTKQAFVESVTAGIVTPKRPGVLYYLTTRGLELVADLVGRADPAHLARMWQTDETALLHLLPRLSSSLALQEVIQELIADAPRMLAYPGGHPAGIRWHWQRDYVHSFEHKKRRMICQMDAAVVFRRRPLAGGEGEESWHCVLLLIDPGLRGSEDLHLIRKRLEQILLWRESSERWSFYHAFPSLLVLAPTQHQRDLWLYSAQEVTTHLRLAPLKGACAVLAERSPWRFSWQLFDGSGSAPLQSLTSSLVPQAIPPGLLAPKQVVREPISGEQARKVIIGNFEKRSKGLAMSEASLKTGAYCALLSLHLDYRHLEILQEIYALPLIAAQELGALLRMEAGTLRRYLYDVQHFQCLTILSTSQGKRLTLSETGLRLISLQLNVPLIHIAERDALASPWQQRGIRYVLRTITHTAGIYAFLAQLQQQAWSQGQELLWWETTRSLRRYRYQGRWHNLMPDALLEYQAGETRIEAWLEWDTGSMHGPALTEKFEAYAQYVRSQQYRYEHRTPPRLLLIAPHTGREQFIRRIAASVLGTLPIAIWTTTEQLLHVSGPLALIWKRGETRHNNEEEQGRLTWIEQR